MAWTDLTLNGEYLDGVDTTTFGHLRKSTIKVAENTDEGRRFKAARQKVRTMLQGPKYLGPFAASYGLSTFFDDLQASADLAEDLQLALAYSYAWFRYTHDSTTPGDIDDVRAERMEVLLKDALAALSQSVPVTLSIIDEAVGQPGVRAIAGAMDTFGRETFDGSDGFP